MFKFLKNVSKTNGSGIEFKPTGVITIQDSERERERFYDILTFLEDKIIPPAQSLLHFTYYNFHQQQPRLA